MRHVVDVGQGRRNQNVSFAFLGEDDLVGVDPADLGIACTHRHVLALGLLGTCDLFFNESVVGDKSVFLLKTFKHQFDFVVHKLLHGFKVAISKSGS